MIVFRRWVHDLIMLNGTDENGLYRMNQSTKELIGPLADIYQDRFDMYQAAVLMARWTGETFDSRRINH